MKFILILLLLFASCTGAETETIEGYPVYKFIDFWEISEKGLSGLHDLDPETLKLSPEELNDLILNYERMLNSGLKNYHRIQLVLTDGAETTVFIPQKTYDILLIQLRDWIKSNSLRPHVEKVYPITEAQAAHLHIETKHTTGKIVISF